MSTVGKDLGRVLEEALARHEARKCSFKPGAFERIAASPEFAALVVLIEAEEEACPLREAA